MLTVCSASAGTTYFVNTSGSNGAPPKCFKFYSDEACKTQVSVTPYANDGNTYVVLGSSKMSGYTAPAGTTWIFGTDGSTVGTKKARPNPIYMNGWGVTVNYGACTIYGIGAFNNDGGYTWWAGTNTLVNCGQNFEFGAVNIGSASRSIGLSGKFIAAEDVTIEITRTGSTDGYHSAHKITGDFSEFKGGVTLAAGNSAARLNGLELTSASAFGDASVARTDYLTVGNWTRWTIGNDVTQSATKGITLDLTGSGTSALYAADGASWTLSAPVATKTEGVGTLQKTGAGTVTLAGSLSVPNLDVKEGTLVIDASATFEKATALTIRSGATVITRQGTAIPNVTVTKEDNAIFSADFTVPYADGATTPLDYSTLTAEGWAGMDRPLPLKLSTPIAHPVNAALRLPMIKLPSALNATAADFSDTTGKTYDLPVTSFEVEKGNDGCDTVYLNVRPVVYLSANSSQTVKGIVYLLEANQTDSSGAEFATWTDGQAVHAGADYVVANGSSTVTGKWWNEGTWTFPGESLTFASGKFATKAKSNEFNCVVFCDGTTLLAHGYANGDCRHVISGDCSLPSGIVTVTLSTEALSGGKTTRRVIDFAGTLTGAGALTYSGSADGLCARFEGDGSSFAGSIKNDATGTESAPAFLECADLNALLAQRTVVNEQALQASGNFSGFHVTEDGTFADNGFGLMLNGYYSSISVAEEKTLTVAGKMVLGHATTSKRGGGTLVLAGTTLYGAVAATKPENITIGSTSYCLELRGGWVKPVAWNNEASYYRTRFKAVSADSGFAFDAEPTDEHIAKYGLCLAYDDAITFASDETTLPIKIDLPETWALANGRRKVMERLAVPVLTVTDACAATLAGKLKVVKNYRGAKASITSAAATDMEGFTTFTVTFEPQGLAVIIR